MWKNNKTYWEISQAINTNMAVTIQMVNRLRARGTNLEKRNPFGSTNPPEYNAYVIAERMRNGESLNDIAISFGKNPQHFSTVVAGWRKHHPNAHIPYINKIKP
jgi:hypothetical protein